MKTWLKTGKPRTCKLCEFGECQNVFTPEKEWGEFCCTEHRKRWHYLNRSGTTARDAYREAVEDAEARRDARMNGHANGHANGHDAGEAKRKTLAELGLASPKVEPKRRRLTAA
jgi:hypothetical protein